MHPNNLNRSVIKTYFVHYLLRKVTRRPVLLQKSKPLSESLPMLFYSQDLHKTLPKHYTIIIWPMLTLIAGLTDTMSYLELFINGYI